MRPLGGLGGPGGCEIQSTGIGIGLGAMTTGCETCCKSAVQCATHWFGLSIAACFGMSHASHASPADIAMAPPSMPRSMKHAAKVTFAWANASAASTKIAAQRRVRVLIMRAAFYRNWRLRSLSRPGPPNLTSQQGPARTRAHGCTLGIRDGGVADRARRLNSISSRLRSVSSDQCDLMCARTARISLSESLPLNAGMSLS